MNEALSVNVGERVHYRTEKIASFLGRKRSALNHQREVFFGVFHHHVEHVDVIQIAASHFQDADQVRMRKFCSVLPASYLGRGVDRIRGDKFDRDFFDWLAGVVGEENSAAFSSAD